MLSWVFSGKQFNKRDEPLSDLSIVNKEDFCGFKFNIIPPNWCVYSLGQELASCYWMCQLINFVDKNDKDECLFVESEDFQNPLDAIKDAVSKIKKLEN